MLIYGEDGEEYIFGQEKNELMELHPSIRSESEFDKVFRPYQCNARQSGHRWDSYFQKKSIQSHRNIVQVVKLAKIVHFPLFDSCVIYRISLSTSWKECFSYQS